MGISSVFDAITLHMLPGWVAQHGRQCITDAAVAWTAASAGTVVYASNLGTL